MILELKNKLSENEYVVMCRKMAGFMGFPPVLQVGDKELELFGVFQVKSPLVNDLSFKTVFMPVDFSDKIMHEEQRYSDSIQDLIVDYNSNMDAKSCVNNYNTIYRFNKGSLTAAVDWAKLLNTIILDSLLVHPYLTNQADLTRYLAEKNYWELQNLLKGIGFNLAFEMLCGYGQSVKLLKTVENKNGKSETEEVWESEFVISRANRFTCNFNEVTISVFKTKDGLCEVSRMVEVWNEPRTESVTIFV